MGGKPDLLSRLVGREQVSCVKPPNADSDETNVREQPSTPGGTSPSWLGQRGQQFLLAGWEKGRLITLSSHKMGHIGGGPHK